ncbi:hypothetical protein BC833DRAFT_620375 [Globomyces pollinis-pini]|nr:hypothetical protein BC833DRAFT_620375 [Globomyces pollinis-pini]
MERSTLPKRLNIHPEINAKFGFQDTLKTPLIPYSPIKRFKDMELPSPRVATKDHWLFGNLLGLLTFIYFGWNVFTLVIVRFYDTSSIRILNVFSNDHYYCYLLPALGPMFSFLVLLNWLGMKYFRHNA